MPSGSSSGRAPGARSVGKYADDPAIVAELVNAELVKKLKEADQLIFQLASVIYKEDIADHIPFGLKDKCKDWLRRGPNEVVSKAEGRA